MRARTMWQLFWLYGRRSRRVFVFSTLGIATGISFLTFFLSLSAGVRQNLLAKAFPIGQLEIVPRKIAYDAGPLSLLSSPRPLDEEFVTALTARPEVATVYPRMQMAFAARAEGGRPILPHDVHAELIGEGLDERAVAADEVSPIPFARRAGTQRVCAMDSECATAAPGGEYCPIDTGKCEPPIPVVLSPFIVELYNSAIAPTHGLPKLGKFVLDRFTGFTFTGELGRSMMGTARTNEPPRLRRFMLVGLSPRAAPLAVTVPLAYVVEWNRLYASADAAAHPTSLLVELKQDQGNASAAVTAFVREHGYAIADSGAEKIGLVVLLLTGLLTLVSIAVLLMAGLTIAQTFFRTVAERRRDIGVMRAVGARPSDIAGWILSEAAVIGAVGGVIGVLLAFLASLVADAVAARVLPDFPFRPDSYFMFGCSLVALAIGCGIVAAVLGALWPALSARRLDPVEALSDS